MINMKILDIDGFEVKIDDQDYAKVTSVRDWRVIDKDDNLMVFHDKHGFLQCFLFDIPIKEYSKRIVEYINNEDTLNYCRDNLKYVDFSKIRKARRVSTANKINFGGVHYEKEKKAFRVIYVNNEKTEKGTGKRVRKTFPIKKYGSANEALKQAILFRIEKMRENAYEIDERSETIEKECLKEDSDMERVLEIDFNDIL